MKLRFLGAAGTVTGSRYLLREGETRLLIDCGLFQGVKTLRLKNWQAFPVPAGSLDAVVLTHAHLDHSGYLPRLVREGFRGPIYCTPATADLLEILLIDSAHLQEEDAERANRGGYSKHRPAEPLYTRIDAERALKQVNTQPLHQGFRIGPFHLRYTRAGHILGAACVSVECGGHTGLFSGDLGRPEDALMLPPEPPPACDYLLIESTYGDRRHAPDSPKDRLAELVRNTAARGGTLLLPAFAVGRAQSLLYLLGQLRAERAIPALPVYLDSPMAIDVTELLVRHAGEHRLSPEACHQVCASVNFVRDAAESEQLSASATPKIIVAGAGMLTGGRILHHLKAFGSDHRNTLALAGYQAPGTRGYALEHGARSLKLYGEYVTIGCRLEVLEGLSAHADYVEIGDWLAQLPVPPKRVFITHGEPVAADHLRCYLGERFGWGASVPEQGDEVELG